MQRGGGGKVRRVGRTGDADHALPRGWTPAVRWSAPSWTSALIQDAARDSVAADGRWPVAARVDDSAASVAEAHGCRATVSSSPGAGAVFTVRLPLVGGAVPAHLPDPRVAPEAPGPEQEPRVEP